MPGLRGQCEAEVDACKKGLGVACPLPSLRSVSGSHSPAPSLSHPLAVSLSLLVFPVPFGPGSSCLCHFQVLALFSGSSVVSLLPSHFSGFGLLLCLTHPLPIPSYLSAQGLPAELPPREACGQRLRFPLGLPGRLLPLGQAGLLLASGWHLLQGMSWAERACTSWCSSQLPSQTLCLIPAAWPRPRPRPASPRAHSRPEGS